MIRWMSSLLALMNTVSDLVCEGSPVSPLSFTEMVLWGRCSCTIFWWLCTITRTEGTNSKNEHRLRQQGQIFACQNGHLISHRWFCSATAPHSSFIYQGAHGWHSSDANTKCPFCSELHLQGLAAGDVHWWWAPKGLLWTVGFGGALVVLLCISQNKVFWFSLQKQWQDCHKGQKIGGYSESGCPGKYTGNIGKEPVPNKENGITLPSICILDVQ